MRKGVSGGAQRDEVTNARGGTPTAIEVFNGLRTAPRQQTAKPHVLWEFCDALRTIRKAPQACRVPGGVPHRHRRDEQRSP